MATKSDPRPHPIPPMMASPSPAPPPPAEPAPPGGLLRPPAGMKLARAAGNEWRWVADDAPPPPGPIDVPAIGDIPDGDPTAVAAMLLGRIRPRSAGELAPRLDGLGRQVDDLVERARLQGANLDEFIRAASRAIRLRSMLEARAAALAGVEAPPPADVAAEVWRLLDSIRRFRDAGHPALWAEWVARTAKARGELIQVEWAIGQTLAAADGHHAHPTVQDPRYRLGLNQRQDAYLLRLEDELGRRASLRARLVALGDDPAARSAAAAAAVDAAGGRGAVASAIAGSMPAADDPASLRARAEEIGRELGRIDPDTRRASELASEREAVVAAIAEAGRADAARRSAAADAMVEKAATGDVRALGELAAAARGVASLPGLAGALEAARGGELRAVVAELVAEALEAIAAGR